MSATAAHSPETPEQVLARYLEIDPRIAQRPALLIERAKRQFDNGLPRAAADALVGAMAVQDRDIKMQAASILSMNSIPKDNIAADVLRSARELLLVKRPRQSSRPERYRRYNAWASSTP